jgi:hypothetical protein
VPRSSRTMSVPQMDIGLVRQIDAAHQRAVVAVAEDQFGRDDTFPQYELFVLDVTEQQVERGDPPDDAVLDALPFLGQQDSRQYVERRDAVGRQGRGESSATLPSSGHADETLDLLAGDHRS